MISFADNDKELITELEERLERKYIEKETLMRIKVNLAFHEAWGDISSKQAFSLLCTAIEKYADFTLTKKVEEMIDERIDELRRTEITTLALMEA